MARLYKAKDDEESGGCPGQDKCETFQRSAADQPPEARCPSCPKRMTGDGGRETEDAGEGARAPSKETFDEELLLDRVDRFRQERNSGRDIYKVMAPVEWECLLIWDELFDTYRRAYEINLAQSMSALMAALLRARNG